MPIQRTFNELVPVRVWTDDIDDSSIRQLENISKMPIIHSHVAAMSHVHVGMGATIGSIIPT